MNLDKLHRLFNTYGNKTELAWEGNCTICEKEIVVAVSLTNSGFEISGGAVYENKPGEYRLKCPTCFDSDPHIYQECDVYSRVVGYLQPIKQWNKGKRAEFKDRKMFNIKET